MVKYMDISRREKGFFLIGIGVAGLPVNFCLWYNIKFMQDFDYSLLLASILSLFAIITGIVAIMRK